MKIPTVLFIYGWRLFFYANESNEPVHIHAEKGDMECKYWILVEEVEIKEVFSFNMSPNARREIKKIIYYFYWRSLTYESSPCDISLALD